MTNLIWYHWYHHKWSDTWIVGTFRQTLHEPCIATSFVWCENQGFWCLATKLYLTDGWLVVSDIWLSSLRMVVGWLFMMTILFFFRCAETTYITGADLGSYIWFLGLTFGPASNAVSDVSPSRRSVYEVGWQVYDMIVSTWLWKTGIRHAWSTLPHNGIYIYME